MHQQHAPAATEQICNALQLSDREDSPVLLDVPLPRSRVLRLRLIETLVVIEVGTITTTEVREILPGIKGKERVARRSESFRPVAVITFPVKALGDVRRALSKIAARGARQQRSRTV